MNEQKNNNGRGIFYGVIGVATLVVAIIGATFAYFTATASGGNNVITGNMATITFDLAVTKVTHVDESKGGMIPMSNNMVEAAVTHTGETGNGTCVDDNGNAVCQIYKIVVNNTGSASLFLDGYVTLTGGSGTPTDADGATTTMRWAQVFCSGSQTDEITGCSTAGSTTTTATGIDAFTQIGNQSDTTGKNTANIKSTMGDVVGNGTISGNTYSIINRNYIRTSQRAAGAEGYDRNGDITSALVYNQFLAPASTTLTTDEVTYYIVVWLSETGTNQTAGATVGEGPVTNPAALSFFSGLVTFNSAQGSEVTATFSHYAAVPSQPQTPSQEPENP